MFESVKTIINPEYEGFVKGIIAKHEDEIMFLLDDLDKHLGQGNTANVRFLESNEKSCLKIYKHPDEIESSIFYLPPWREQEFLMKLKDLGVAVRVPKVYAAFEDVDSGSGHHRFLMMETLPAVSVDDTDFGIFLHQHG